MIEPIDALLDNRLSFTIFWPADEEVLCDDVSADVELNTTVPFSSDDCCLADAEESKESFVSNMLLCESVMLPSDTLTIVCSSEPMKRELLDSVLKY